MNMSVRLNNLAAVSTGTARAVFESANAAYRAIFEARRTNWPNSANSATNSVMT